MKTRKFALMLTLLAGTLVASTAHAGGPGVQLSVELFTPTIRLPGHVVLPLPPIPVPHLAVIQSRREAVYVEPRYAVSDEGNYQGGYDNGRVRYYVRGDADRDGDGVPNRYDSRPNDPRYSRGWQETPCEGRGDRHDDRRGHRGD